MKLLEYGPLAVLVLDVVALIDLAALELAAVGRFKEMGVLLNTYVEDSSEVSGRSCRAVGRDNICLPWGAHCPNNLSSRMPKGGPIPLGAPPWLADSRVVPTSLAVQA